MAASNLSVSESAAEKPWHAAYPAPKSTAAVITRESLLSWMQEGKLAGKNFVLVDLRRTDFEGGTIRGSINLPAQSLYPTIPSMCTLFSTSGILTVIWYCGSSRGRGNRAAGWFADYIKEQNNTEMESCTLEGGIKGWVAGGKEYVEMMDEYDAAVWK
ncbi:arsenate reductase (Arc2) protein [Rutstroemia sp. NJR-2017a WRK4]|nr:arsenate reductase (Arc2) protein [Rutstroemia sp. NJR-2017a WRK4]